ncbi:MAG: transcription antitermination factor NusB [Gammaproteobacteria bacterium]|nr:transcription antitermination factor NusB [Gammaproteobacteria bacterium]
MNVEARELAIQALYEYDLRGEGPSSMPARTARLVNGVLTHQAELDETLDAVSKRWRVARMAPVDRAVLRLALYELRFEPETSVGVIISEAVRLAKKYSTDKSSSFVNGILGRLARTER